MDDYHVFEYVSHTGNTSITSLRMISDGKAVTVNFLSVSEFEQRKYSHEPKDILQKHPAMDEIEEHHRANLRYPRLSHHER